MRKFQQHLIEFALSPKAKVGAFAGSNVFTAFAVNRLSTDWDKIIVGDRFHWQLLASNGSAWIILVCVVSYYLYARFLWASETDVERYRDPEYGRAVVYQRTTAAMARRVEALLEQAGSLDEVRRIRDFQEGR